MSLFPKCTFQVLLNDGAVVPGRRAEGVLVATAPEAIPRAEHLGLVFRSKAWVGYGSGKQRSVVRRELFQSPLHVDLPNMLPAGTHRYPFAIDIPPWLPPGMQGNDCAIEHVIDTRLDVDWAVDPSSSAVPPVAVVPREGTRKPLLLRSPAWFHEAIVLEVTLESSVFGQDEALSGQVALRSGQATRFEAVELCLASSFVMIMGRGERRRGLGRSIRIPANMLRAGEAVPFQFPASQHVMPTVRSSIIDHDMMLTVSVDIAWARDPSFDIILDAMPRGSILHGVGGGGVVGGERLRRLGAAMAQGTGLREGGRPPTLVEGMIGPVAVRIADAPREATLGIDVDFTFPDVELGIVFRTLGMLEGFRESPLLPKDIAGGHLLRLEPTDERPAADERAAAAFVATVLAELNGATELRFSDHHLGAHFAMANDGADQLVAIAHATRAKGAAIADAIARLPFPAAAAASQAAWQAAAAEQGAVLVPTGPSLHGLAFRARVVDGQERVIGASIRTVWTKTGPTTRVELDLRDAQLPKAAWTELEGEVASDRLRGVRATFPTGHVLPEGAGATLERPEWTPDPRALLPALELFVGWVLDARGERRADQPYR